MPKFTPKDIEHLKTGGVSKSELKQIVPSTIENSDNVQANVRTFDVKSGHYEILLTGTLSPNVMHDYTGTPSR